MLNHILYYTKEVNNGGDFKVFSRRNETKDKTK